MIMIGFRLAFCLPRDIPVDRTDYTNIVKNGINNVKFMFENRKQIVEVMEDIKKKKIKFINNNAIFITLETRDVYNVLVDNFDKAAGSLSRNTSKLALAVYLVKNNL